jgi:Resolvase, N terminal domain
MLIGYARVSTAEQNLDLETDALTKAGCDKIFTDTACGATSERPGLANALNFIVETQIKITRTGSFVRRNVPTDGNTGLQRRPETVLISSARMSVLNPNERML